MALVKVVKAEAVEQFVGQIFDQFTTAIGKHPMDSAILVSDMLTFIENSRKDAFIVMKSAHSNANTIDMSGLGGGRLH